MDKYNKSVQHQWFHHATWGDSKYKNEGIGEVLWHSLTEDGKVEVVNIKFGNKTYENVSVKHLNPTDESHHSHKRTGTELKKKKKVKEGMIKLKDMINENREIDKVYGDFEVLLKDFEKEFISLSAQAGRANDNKADERIMIKTLKKHLPPLYSMVRSWKRSSKGWLS